MSRPQQGNSCGTRSAAQEFPIAEALALLEREAGNLQVPLINLLAVQAKEPFKILVATILSARTRDEVTAVACHRLFRVAGDLAQLARLTEEEIAALIYPVGFYRQKAQYLAQLPTVLLREFRGLVPDTLESLLTLPGVGRKTANLVLATAFGTPAICVDTHVHRITNIWGYVKTSSPLATEMALRNQLPRHYWLKINPLLVALGQGICEPRRPQCERCVVSALCRQIGAEK